MLLNRDLLILSELLFPPCGSCLGRRSGWEAEELPSRVVGWYCLPSTKPAKGRAEGSVSPGHPPSLSYGGPEGKEKVMPDPGLLTFYILRLNCPATVMEEIRSSEKSLISVFQRENRFPISSLPFLLGVMRKER